jgi:hypothetical protein
MTMLISQDPVLEKLHKHLESLGQISSIVEKKLDFESDFMDGNYLGSADGIGNIGTLRLYDSPIDYINIIKKQELTKCDFVAGGFAGMGLHLHSWWKMRFFLSFPEEVKLGPFDIGTISTVKKGLFHSELENFVWSGYQKLTTLPPGLIKDNLGEELYTDQDLKKLMRDCLIHERTIFVSRYAPTNSEKGIPTGSKIIVQSSWKLQKDLLINQSTFEMYKKIAEIVKMKINSLKYHLK